MTAPLALALALAAAPAIPPLTLDEAVGTALARRPVLRAAGGQAEAADAAARQARGALLPQLGAGARYDVSRDEPAGGGTARTRDGASASLSADVLVWDFGRTSSRVRSALASAEAAAHGAAATARDVVLEVRVAYFGLLAASALEEVAREALANQERHLAQTEEMVRIGTRAAVDLARLRTQAASARAAWVRAQGGTRAARARLDVAMGVPAHGAYAPIAPELPPLRVELEPTGALFAEALRTRPELASLRAAVEARGHSVFAAERALRPSLRAGAGLSAVTDPPLWPPGWGSSVGVTLSWPIFDGRASQAAADAERARLEVDRAQLDDREQRVWEEIEGAVTAVESSRAQLPAAEEALAAARDLLRLAEARYREGVGSSLELADAQLELSSAAAERVRVGYDLASARAQLLRSLGRDTWE
jgi:outer membrane protein